METLLPEIDREQTKQAVEDILEKYRIYLLREPLEQLPKVTQNYSLEMPSFTNAFHSSTEESAIHNVDFEIHRKSVLNNVQRAVNRLGYWERAIIIQKYMTQDNVFDYEVYNDLNMSEKKYYRIKARAFYKLAFSLRIEVFEEEMTEKRPKSG